MSATHQIDDSWYNGSEESEEPLFVLPYSALLEAGRDDDEADTDDDVWWTAPDPIRSVVPAVPCPRCGHSATYLEPHIPGESTLHCWGCGELGAAAHSEIAELSGPAGSISIVYAETHIYTGLWDRDDTDEP